MKTVAIITLITLALLIAFMLALSVWARGQLGELGADWINEEDEEDD